MAVQLACNAPETYEEVIVPLWFERWADALIELLMFRPGENVFYVAFGTGVTTRIARDKVGCRGTVTGLEINAAMITKPTNLPVGHDIEWLEGDASDSGPDERGSGRGDVLFHAFVKPVKTFFEVNGSMTRHRPPRCPTMRLSRAATRQARPTWQAALLVFLAPALPIWGLLTLL